MVLIRKYNYSVPVMIFVVVAGFSCLNNFGWDFFHSDLLTYGSSLLGFGGAYYGYRKLSKPIDFGLVILKGVMPVLRERYSGDDGVLCLLGRFDEAIRDYESSEDSNGDSEENDSEGNDDSEDGDGVSPSDSEGDEVLDDEDCTSGVVDSDSMCDACSDDGC